MGSKGRVPPPSHLMRPVPGSDMLHPDPFGPGIRPPHGAFHLDMLPHPEIMEQKLVAQDVEMQKLLRENQRIAASHSVLRHELAAAQQELQRLHSHIGGMKDEHEHHMRASLDKMAKMEADLKASETLKVELQHVHAEAQGLTRARQELMMTVQQLTLDLEKNHAELQKIPALLSELANLKLDYQHCRESYDYERKLRIDHYESLQIMEKNYVSMVREVEKLRAELTNATNIDKSGGSHSNSGGYKENDNTTGRHSVGQNAYEDVYGIQQGRGPSGGGTVTYAGGQAGVGPRSGYDTASYDDHRGGSFEPSKGASSAGYEVPRGGPAYVAATKGVGGTQAPTIAGNVAGPHGSTQTASPYKSAQAPSPYGSSQAPPPYGSAQAPNPYGMSQTSNPYGSTQAANPYGSSAQVAKPYGSSAQAANPYGLAQVANPYGSAQTSNPYGSVQGSNSYASSQTAQPYGSAQAANPYGATGYDAPARGGGGGGNTRK